MIQGHKKRTNGCTHMLEQKMYLTKMFCSNFALIDNEKHFGLTQVVTKTFHSAGIVVPVDKNDVGYRELPETDGELLECLSRNKH